MPILAVAIGLGALAFLLARRGAPAPAGPRTVPTPPAPTRVNVPRAPGGLPLAPVPIDPQIAAHAREAGVTMLPRPFPTGAALLAQRTEITRVTQQQLQNLGLFGRNAIDGQIGPATRAAVQVFLSANRLAPDPSESEQTNMLRIAFAIDEADLRRAGVIA